MPIQNLLINTFAAIKSVITPSSSPPPSPVDSSTAKASHVTFPMGFIPYDAEKAFQIPKDTLPLNESIWIPIR